MQKSITARAVAGSSGLRLRWRVAVAVEVVTVNVVVETVVPESAKVGGEKLHVAPEGNPEQVNETTELKPFNGVIDTVVVPLLPAVTVSDVGDAPTEKSCGGRLMV